MIPFTRNIQWGFYNIYFETDINGVDHIYIYCFLLLESFPFLEEAWSAMVRVKRRD